MRKSRKYLNLLGKMSAVIFIGHWFTVTFIVTIDLVLCSFVALFCQRMMLHLTTRGKVLS